MKRFLLIVGVAVGLGFGLTTATSSPTNADSEGWHYWNCGDYSNPTGYCQWSCVMDGHPVNPEDGDHHCCVSTNEPDKCWCWD